MYSMYKECTTRVLLVRYTQRCAPYIECTIFNVIVLCTEITLNVHQVYTQCTSNVHSMYIQCTSKVYTSVVEMYIDVCVNVHCSHVDFYLFLVQMKMEMYTKQNGNGHYWGFDVVYTRCTLSVHSMYIECTLDVPCTLDVH